MSKPTQTLDLTGLDYAFTPRQQGQEGTVTCWSGRKPDEGDFLLLRNGDRSTRYRVTSVDYCMNVDPATMYIARVEFAPRLFADETRTIDVPA